MTNVFIIGSKGIPARYGGFETFVQKLVDGSQNRDIRYHVACMPQDQKEDFDYRGARCFVVNIPNIGGARAPLYDVVSLWMCVRYVRKHNVDNSLVYILGSRIGPFLSVYKKILERNGMQVLLNPDGHEWKRSKWNRFVRWYWKLSERFMVKHSDMVVCDSVAIESYIKTKYRRVNPLTTFIAYGAELCDTTSTQRSAEVATWLEHHDLAANNYYLMVGRFVPENNFELIIREYLKSSTLKPLVIITNQLTNMKFYKHLDDRLKFTLDRRIKFVGTVYNENLLISIRQSAFAYLHGHQVGGTNPSLLEALSTTSLNILYDVNFNREVGGDSVLYFDSQDGSLKETIERAECMSVEDVMALQVRAKQIIQERYSWESIIDKYETLFLTTETQNHTVEEALLGFHR